MCVNSEFSEVDEDMFDEIRDVPNFPEEIREAFDKQELVIFLGAGISRLAGCPSWNDLASGLLKELKNIKAIDFKTSEQLRYLSDNKKIITIAHNIFCNLNREDDFYRVFNNALVGEENSDVYNALKSIHTLYVTTNADTLLEKALFEDDDTMSAHSFANCREMDISEMKSPSIVHIHGRYDDRKSLVFTTSQYLNAYNSKEFVGFIKRIFSQYQVLFLGYGLNEFELIDYLISKNSTENGKQLKHFYLDGFFSYELEYAKHIAGYFETLGVQLIPYSKDIKGYDQQIEIIQDWANEINRTSFIVGNELQQINELVGKFSENNYQRLKYLIQGKPVYERKFYEKVSLSKDSLLWIERLSTDGFLNIGSCPKIIWVNESNYKAKGWDILDTILKVLESERNNENKLERILTSLLKGAKKKIEVDEDVLRNWILINQLWKIYLLLPKKSISLGLIDVFKVIVNDARVSNDFVAEGINDLKVIKELKIEKYYFFYEFILGFIVREGRPIALLEGYLLESIANDIKSEINSDNAIVYIELVEEIIIKLVELEDYTTSYNLEIPVLNIQEYVEEYSYIIFLTDLLHESLLKAPLEELKKSTVRWMTNSTSFFNVVALYCVSENYDGLHDILFGTPNNPLDLRGLSTQLYILLKDNVEVMNEDEINKAIEWIMSSDFELNDSYKEDPRYQKILVSNRIQFLEILIERSQVALDMRVNLKKSDYYELDNPISAIKKKYNRFEVTDYVPELFFGEELAAVSIDDFDNYLSKKLLKSEIKRFDLSVIGKELKEYINDTVNYDDGVLDVICKQKPLIIGAVIEAFSIGYENHSSKVRDKIMKFVKSNVVSQYKEEYSDGANYLLNKAVIIIDKFIDLTKDIKKIKSCIIYLNKIISVETWKKESNIDEIHSGSYSGVESYALNTLLKGFLVLKGKNNDDNYSDIFFDYISNDLNKQGYRSKTRSFVSSRITNFLYLDKERTLKLLDVIFWINSSELSISAISGYAYLNNILYADIYSYLKNSGLLVKMIKTDFEITKGDFDYRSKYVKIIVLAALVGFDEKDDELFNDILKKKRDILAALSMLNDTKFYENVDSLKIDEVKKKSLYVWNFLYENNLYTDDEVYQELIRYICILDSIDDEYGKKIIECLRKIKKLSREYKIINSLKEFVENGNNIETISEICIVIVEKVDYITKFFLELVDLIYYNGNKHEAIGICNHGIDKGFSQFEQLLIKYKELELVDNKTQL